MKTYTVSTRIAKYEIPEGMLALECDYCHSLLGIFWPENVKVPIKGSMFESIHQNRGMPKPFLSSMGRETEDSWKYCTCMACGNNCFYDRKTNKCKAALLTPFGVWEIGSKNIPRKLTQADKNQEIIKKAFEEEISPVPNHCRYCNKYYVSDRWLEQHEQKCKGEDK